jgi:hypothetical protein
VRETALALCGMEFDPQSLVLACRRIVERHPTTAQLWWLCAHVLSAAEPFARARELARATEHDDLSNWNPRVLLPRFFRDNVKNLNVPSGLIEFT